MQNMPERQCILYTTQYIVDGAAEPPHPAGARPDLGSPWSRFTMSGTVDRATHTIWMDGRPGAVGQRAAHGGRLFHRQVGGAHADGDHPRT
jgi:hypothetical protein